MAARLDALAPVMDDELAGLIEDLGEGFGPEISQIVAGFKALAEKAHTTDSTQTVLTVIGGNCPNLISLAAAVAAHLGSSATNPALGDLPVERREEVRDLTRQYAAYDEAFAPRDLLSDASAAIDGI
ncbi:hypothetical protein [Streptomyces asiaticus]|uniref:hypothetical protein n=1 Tax=Streptomyces asiaticus TaxID=114695 RepID=UPI00382F47E3